MTHINDTIKLVGFIRKDKPTFLKHSGKPRIHIAYKSNDELWRIGWQILPYRKTVRLEPVLHLVDYPVTFCEIDIQCLEPQDIKYYKTICGFI